MKRYPAAGLIPAQPTYAFAARTVRDAQRSLRDAVDGLGAIDGVDAAGLGAEFQRELGFDPLDPDSLARLGIDVDGGIAVFAEGLNPTFVVAVRSRETLQAFVDEQRSRGLATESVVVDGAEIVTTRFNDGGAGPRAISWVFDDRWCWFHVAFAAAPEGHDDGTAWFTGSRRPAARAWIADWEYAARAAGGEPAFLGFVDLARLVGRVVPKVAEARACAALLAPIQRVAIAIDGTDRRVGAKLSLEVGPASAAIARTLLGQPEGWAAAAQTAAVALSWNVDYPAVRDWAAPCTKLAEMDLRPLDAIGLRSARAMLHAIDLDGPSGRGVVAMDLTSKQYFARHLDDIPLRRTIESRRTFGPHQGAHLSIPFGPKVDYVLTDRLALVGMGEGLLGQVVGSGKTVAGPLVSVDLAPQALSRETWLSVAKLVDADGWVFGGRFIDQMRRWKAGRIAVTLDGTRLVLEAGGTRL